MKRHWQRAGALASILAGIVALTGHVGAQRAAGPATSSSSGPATVPSSGPAIPKGWVQISAGPFSFWCPPDLKDEKSQGIDSLVGQFTSPTMKLFFDYGWYSDPMKDPKYKQEDITLDGRDAVIVTWDGGVGLYVPKVEPVKGLPTTGNRLSMTISCSRDLYDQARLILRSVKFAAPAATEPAPK